jgi:hypothetical protein
MHVGVGLSGEVVVEDDVDPLDVKAARAQVRRHHDARLELLELVVRRDPARSSESRAARRGRAQAAPTLWRGTGPIS